jgi:hypothetical protein
LRRSWLRGRGRLRLDALGSGRCRRLSAEQALEEASSAGRSLGGRRRLRLNHRFRRSLLARLRFWRLLGRRQWRLLDRWRRLLRLQRRLLDGRRFLWRRRRLLDGRRFLWRRRRLLHGRRFLWRRRGLLGRNWRLLDRSLRKRQLGWLWRFGDDGLRLRLRFDRRSWGLRCGRLFDGWRRSLLRRGLAGGRRFGLSENLLGFLKSCLGGGNISSGLPLLFEVLLGRFHCAPGEGQAEPRIEALNCLIIHVQDLERVSEWQVL